MNVSTWRGFFGVVAESQSYINILYLLLAFPLGTIYFVFLVTGLSTGLGLVVTLIGIPLLLLVLGGSWVLCEFERRVTTILLKEDISPPSIQPISEGLLPRLKAHLSNRTTWTGILYLLLKFPLGIATFTIAVTLIAVTLGLLLAPTFSWAGDPNYLIITWGDWEFDPFPWSWIFTLIGIPMVFISLHIMNLTAFISGRFTRAMLGKL